MTEESPTIGAEHRTARAISGMLQERRFLPRRCVPDLHRRLAAATSHVVRGQRNLIPTAAEDPFAIRAEGNTANTMVVAQDAHHIDMTQPLQVTPYPHGGFFRALCRVLRPR